MSTKPRHRHAYGPVDESLIGGDDVLDEAIGDVVWWTRVNVGEAWPGVPTPLTWTWGGPSMDEALARAWVALGVFPRARLERGQSADQRFSAISAGRVLLNLDLLRAVGDRLPMNSGDKMEASLFGDGRTSRTSKSVPSRYPFVLTKLPVAAWRARKAILDSAEATRQSWSEATSSEITAERARELLRDTATGWAHIGELQAINTIAAQAAFEALNKLCSRYGLENAAGILATNPSSPPSWRR